MSSRSLFKYYVLCIAIAKEIVVELYCSVTHTLTILIAHHHRNSYPPTYSWVTNATCNLMMSFCLCLHPRLSDHSAGTEDRPANDDYGSGNNGSGGRQSHLSSVLVLVSSVAAMIVSRRVLGIGKEESINIVCT